MKKPAAPKPRPGVSAGDHIYFRHESGPTPGRVLACGQHGVTVHCDGERHHVRWDGILGHKRRAKPNYKVVDSGEDGVIAEDERGRRRFIAGELPEPEERDDMGELQKSVLLLKAGSGAGRPGLSLQATADKQGHQVKRWKRTGPKDKGGDDRKAAKKDFGSHNVKPGDGVAFHHEGDQHHGDVVAAGKDGATVKHAETGDHHKVFWHEVADHAPKQEERQAAADADEIAKTLFSEKEIADLSPTAKQPVGPDDKDKLYSMSGEALDQFTGQLKGVAKDLDIEHMQGPPEDVEDWGKKGGMLFIAPLKGEKRAAEKVEADYGGDWSKLADVVRASIAVDTMGELKDVLNHLKENGLELAKSPKNRFAKPTGEGYRDLLMNVKFPNGTIGELQLHVKPMLEAKNEGHKHYEVTRTLQGKHNSDEPTDEWPDEDHKKFYEAKKAQQKIYADAWDKAKGGDETLTKSFGGSKMIMLFCSPRLSK